MWPPDSAVSRKEIRALVQLILDKLCLTRLTMLVHFHSEFLSASGSLLDSDLRSDLVPLQAGQRRKQNHCKSTEIQLLNH